MDLLPLNVFVGQMKFQTETVESLHISIWKNDLIFSIDLKDTFFQIPINPRISSDLLSGMQGHNLLLEGQWLFKKNFVVIQVLHIGTWQSQMMSTSFCLRDVIHKSLDTSSRPVVVALRGVYSLSA